MGGGAFGPFGGGVGQLVPCIHIAPVVIFKQNQPVPPKGCAQCASHADIHAAVTADHDKYNVSGRDFSLFLFPVTDFRKAA